MENRIFNDNAIGLLLNPAAWKLITSFAPPDVAPLVATNPRSERKHPYHVHRHCEVMIVLSGRSHYGFRGKVYPATPGTVFLFNPHEEHDQGYPPEATDSTHLWIGILPDHCSAWILDHRRGDVELHSRGKCQFTWQEVGIDLYRGLNDPTWNETLPSPLRRARCLATLAAIMCVVVEKGYISPEVETREANQRRIIESIQQHLLATAGHGASLAALSRMAGFSKYHFLRVFRKQTGQSVQEYINFCRLQRVKELLDAKKSHKQIAAELGFSCPQSYCRWLAGYRQKI